MVMNLSDRVAIYIRLSKEDDNFGESESIQNQRLLLTKYVKEQGFSLFDIYIDDGYTGTNFERPAFKRMLKDIELGKINVVVTKDLSRLSRDYIGTGEYVEKWFPAHGVRYIALTDAIDTAIDSANNDIAPFKAILNDMYAKDLSKKIRTALKTMQMEGKWVGGCPPLGYEVDSNDKNHLVINERESEIVKRIFDLFINGNKINQIKNILNNERVPTFYMMRNRENGKRNIYGCWSSTTIKKILQNRLYTGDMVQNRRSRVSYKYRKIICNPREQWIIKENTHEAIINRKTFIKVQELLPKQRQRSDKKDIFLLDGLLKCADCGNNIGIKARRANGKATTVCNYYRQHRSDETLCTSHGFDYDTIEKGVLETIKRELLMLNFDEVMDKVNTNYDMNDNIKKLEREITDIKINIDNMYIDKISNKISEEMYERIYVKLSSDILNKERKIDSIKNKNKCDIEILNNYKFDRKALLKLVKYIAIHHDGNIDVHFNFKKLNII